MINVSHLAGADRGALRRRRAGAGIRIDWSREAEPLETAGGIAQARALLGEAPFLLVNADIWCEFDFSRLRNFQLEKRLSHLVLVPNPPWHPKGDFSLERGIVGNAAGADRATLTRASRCSRRAWSTASPPARKAQLAPLWRAAAERGEVSGELYEGHWSDVGTPQRLAELTAQLDRR